MRIKDGFVLREVAGQAVVVATGEASEDFHGIVKLNLTGATVWRALDEGLGVSGAAARLVEQNAGLDPERARADAEAFAERMAAEGFLA